MVWKAIEQLQIELVHLLVFKITGVFICENVELRFPFCNYFIEEVNVLLNLLFKFLLVTLLFLNNLLFLFLIGINFLLLFQFDELGQLFLMQELVFGEVFDLNDPVLSGEVDFDELQLTGGAVGGDDGMYFGLVELEFREEGTPGEGDLALLVEFAAHFGLQLPPEVLLLIDLDGTILEDDWLIEIDVGNICVASPPNLAKLIGVFEIRHIPEFFLTHLRHLLNARL